MISSVQRTQRIVLIIAIMAVILAALSYVYRFSDNRANQTLPDPDNNGAMTACTMEAKLCADGSAVGRSGPNCEFAACPGE